MLAVSFASHFLLEDVTALRDTVTIFSVAVLIASVLFAADPGSVHAVEGFVLLEILAWACVMGVRPTPSYTALGWQGTFCRKIFNQLILLVCFSLHVWFWAVGVDKMEQGRCGTWVIYVVKVDMYGWVRKLMLGLIGFMLLVNVYWGLVEAVRPWAYAKTEGTRKSFTGAIRAWEKMREKEMISRVGSMDLKRSTEEGEHDGYSEHFCSRCSSVQSDFRLDQHTTLVTSRTKPSLSRPSPESPTSNTDEENLSQPSTAASLKPPSSNDLSDQVTLPDVSILHQIYQSELYIRHCLRASPFATEDLKLTSPLTILRTLFLPPKPISTSAPTNHPPLSWIGCYTRIHYKYIFRLRFPTQSLALYAHLLHAQRLDPLNGPFQLYASASYPHRPLPSWQHAHVAASLVLGPTHAPKKAWLAWYYAIGELATHVLIIAQLELTLVWNEVQDMTVLWSSVGQLIPFVIGVGGLGLVLCRWVVKMWQKRRRRRELDDGGKAITAEREEDDRSKEIFGVSGDIREGWERWKKEYESGLDGTGDGSV